MLKAKIKLALLALLFSFIFLGIGYLIALYISGQNNSNLKDTLFGVGLFVTIFGLLLSMKGNPSGGSLTGMGMLYGQYSAAWNLEVTRVERDSTNYYRDFLKHSVVELAFGNITIILSGIMMIVLCLLLP